MMTILPRTTTKRSARSTGVSTLVRELDPENTSLKACMSALDATFHRYMEYQVPESRKPCLWELADKNFVLGMSGGTDETNAREQQFLKELLEGIHNEQQQLDAGIVQRIKSLPAVVASLRDMAIKHQWDIAIPVETALAVPLAIHSK